jgi:hypothetical protein
MYCGRSSAEREQRRREVAKIPVHKAQVITYLKILNLPLGLLINFNTVLIKDGIQRILNIPKVKSVIPSRR